MNTPQRPPVGAWVWEENAFKNPEDMVQRAQQIGLDYLQLMVNPKPNMLSRTHTDPKDTFALPNTQDVAKLSQIARNPPSGRPLSIGLTSWLVPDEKYINDAKQLIDLCGEVEATSLLWDVEDPWQYGTNMPLDQAAALVGENFRNVKFDVGVTSYADLPTFAPSVVAQFPIGVPQAYSPVDDIKPGDGQTAAYSSWSAQKGPGGAPVEIVMGLAAYDQDWVFGEFKIEDGHKVQVTSPDAVEPNMTSALHTALGLAPRSICYWSLEFMTGASAATLQALLAGTSSSPPPATNGHTYTVEPGDTLSKIAAAHGTTLAALIKANPDITNPDHILVGQVITLP